MPAMPKAATDFEILEWAYEGHLTPIEQLLFVRTGELPKKMAKSNATGRSLSTNGHLGADMIRLAAGDGFQPHTHPGDHLLIVVAGRGTITYQGQVHPTRAGQIYMIEGSQPHAVGAITDHVILAVGSPHMPVDSPERMGLVEYAAVAADMHDLTCLICNTKASYPEMLHDSGCPHCPCAECNPIREG